MMSLLSNKAIFEYVHDKVKEIDMDMEMWGFGIEDMDEWTRATYEAYSDLLNVIMGRKE
jgi:uncharacterized protein YfkK (UPF0435 family)